MVKIGIVLGSVRDFRFGEQIAQWVMDYAQTRGDAEFTLIDVKDFDLPFVTDAVPPMQKNKQYEDERVQRWSNTIDELDGFIFITSEYNHGVPGAFKNAVDHLSSEFAGKAVAFIGYASDGAIRAVEQWRTVAGGLSMYDIRPQLTLSLFSDAKDWREFTPAELRSRELVNLVDELVATTTKLRS